VKAINKMLNYKIKNEMKNRKKFVRALILINVEAEKHFKAHFNEIVIDSSYKVIVLVEFSEFWNLLNVIILN
jgi:hypothetical protein